VSLLVSESLPVARVRLAAPGDDTSGDTSSGDASISTGGTTNDSATRIADAAVQTAQGSLHTTSGSAPTATTGAVIGSALRSSGNSVGSAQTEAPGPAYVMPNLIGLSLSAASARVAAMGLRINSVERVPNRVQTIAPVGSVSPPAATHNGQPAPIRPIAPIGPIMLSDTVVAQSPVPGHRVTKNDIIHIALSH